MFVGGRIYIAKMDGTQGSGNSTDTLIIQKKTFAPSVCVTGGLLVYVALPNMLCFNTLANVPLNEFRYPTSVRAMYPNSYGIMAVVVDTANQVFVYSPVTDELLPVDFGKSDRRRINTSLGER